MNRIYRIVRHRTLGNWVVASELARGRGKNGCLRIATLLVSLGAAAAAHATTIDGGNTIDVSQANPWDLGQALYVGNTGNGTLNITDGGMVANTLGVIGYSATGNGLVTVSGIDSTWNNSGSLTVGDKGRGTLAIGTGATVTSTSGFIGKNTAFTSSVIVSGDGAAWNLSEVLKVGVAGNGALSIFSGGTVSSPGAQIGSGTSGSGSAIVSGQDAVWALNNMPLHVGMGYSTGRLDIEAGGKVIDAMQTYIGNGSDSLGTLNLTGEGSILTNNNAIYIGATAGAMGTLDIRDGATVVNQREAAVGYGVNGIGVAQISGTGSSWNNGAYMSVGRAGSGRLSIRDGATVSNAIGHIGEKDTATGSVTVAGSGALWTNTQLNVGNGGVGTLDISQGGRVDSTGTTIAVATTSVGTVNIGAAVGETAIAAGALATPTVKFGAGAGLLNFNHTDVAYRLDAAISGKGSLQQNGTGTTTLTGDSTLFTGTTQVNAGTLRVDGTLGSTDATLSVNAGGTLTGAGTAGGNVTIAAGGTLAGVQGQTLTTGALALDNGANLDVALGASGSNALFKVNGNLSLASAQLNISDLGGFGTGVYRLIDYTGALAQSGTGLGINTLPGAVSINDVAVQTAVDKQVNLVSIAGTPLDFWDGYGNGMDGAVNGGDGIWNAANTHWTNANGTINSNWRDSAFAIFQGQAGTISVDSGLGDIAVSGMQFATDGYAVEGDAITLNEAESIIRVGDGTRAGSGLTATIASALTGTATLVKTDYGTLVLSGANTYGGGTTIVNGVVRISSDANLGAASGALVLGHATQGNGTLATTADIASSRNVTLLGSHGTFDTLAGTTLTLDGRIDGSGSLVKQGDGMLTLNAANAYTGDTQVEAGVLTGNAGSIRGNLSNRATTIFDQANAAEFTGDVSGSGTVRKQGVGELTLAGSSSANWQVSEGILHTAAERFEGNTQVDAAGALVFEQTNDAIYAGVLSGEGAFNKTGNGTLTLTGGNTLSGVTTIGAGILQAGMTNVFSAGSVHALTNGAVLALDGFDQTIAGLDNSGRVTFAGTRTAGTTLTVAGDYVGNGGTLLMNSVLGGDDSVSDKLIVQGDTRGNTFVQVNNVGGAGAATDDGIHLVGVAGASDGVFELQGRAVTGLYDYQLHKGGKNTPDDGGWYLRSEYTGLANPVDPTPEQPEPPVQTLRPEPASYLGNQNAALRMFQHTMHDRVGEPGLTAREGDGQGYATWVRVRNSNLDAGTVGGQIDIDSNATVMQMGVEKKFAVGEGRMHAGVMGGYGRAITDGTSHFTGHKAHGEVKGTNLGVYGTWFQNGEEATGLYVDGVAQYGRFDNTVKGDYLGREQYDSKVWSGSLEAGYAMQVHSSERYGVYVEPQAQVIYTDFSSDTVTESNGTVVQSRDAGGTTTRLGARLYSRPLSTQYNRVQPFVAVNWWSGGNASTIAMDGERLSRDLPKNTYEAKVGAQLELGQGWSGWGQVGYQSGSDGYRDVSGQVGVKLSW